jgi:Sec-independent protein translocase protein TatA
MNFQGTLRTWVPDGSEAIKVGRAPMVMGGSLVPMNAIQNGNIISWQDIIKINNQPFPMYAVEYVIPAEPEGSISKSRHYTKKFVFPTLINKVPLNIIIKVTKGIGETIIIKDEKGSNIQTSNSPLEDNNSVLYTFDTPQFKEINIEFSKSAIDITNIAPYLIIGLLIVLVLAYPVIRKKSPKLQEIEGKIKNSLKRETESEEQEDREKEGSNPEDKDLSGKSKDKLETEKNELLSKLEKLEKDYASGDLIDEEYEELRNSYQVKLKKIERRIE